MSKIKSIIAAVGAFLATLVALLVGARRSGRARERADHLEDELEESEANNEIVRKQRDAVAAKPRDRESVRDRLRDGSA